MFTIRHVVGTSATPLPEAVYTVDASGRPVVHMPNARGADGRLHRKRFAVMDAESPCVGAESIEVHGPDGLVAEFQPTGWRLTREALELRGHSAVPT